MQRMCWGAVALTTALWVGAALGFDARCGPCGGGHGRAAIVGVPDANPCGNALAFGCCERSPSRWDSIWDGYCDGARRCGQRACALRQRGLGVESEVAAPAGCLGSQQAAPTAPAVVPQPKPAEPTLPAEPPAPGRSARRLDASVPGVPRLSRPPPAWFH
jgi:hypothetical protein